MWICIPSISNEIATCLEMPCDLCLPENHHLGSWTDLISRSHAVRVWKTAAADASVVVAATNLEDYLVPLFDNECYLLTASSKAST